MRFLFWIFSGILASWLAGLLLKGQGIDLIGDLVISRLVGGFGLLTVCWLGYIFTAAQGGIVLIANVRVSRGA